MHVSVSPSTVSIGKQGKVRRGEARKNQGKVRTGLRKDQGQVKQRR